MYYSRSVRVLSRDDALNQHKFGLLNHTGEFNTASVTALARRRDRADYNLPDEHENLTIRAVGQAFLPCYLIRARMRSGYRSLIYTAADSSADDAYLEGITRNWPGLDQVMHTEDNIDAAMRDELTPWLEERGLSTTQLSWDGYDVPRLTLPARYFPPGDAPAKGRGEFPLRQVGSYVTPQSFVVQLWCTDPETRREAALQRALEYADVTHRNETAITQFLGQISARLAVEPELSVSDLRAYARRTGRGVLGI